VSTQGRPLILFGAGDTGKMSHDVLVRRGITITEFCDNHPAKHGSQSRGVDVWRVDRLDQVSKDAYVLVCGNYMAAMSATPAQRRLGCRTPVNRGLRS